LSFPKGQSVEVDPGFRTTGGDSLGGSPGQFGRAVWTSQGVRKSNDW
jgi:hypothetical protein